jgi:ribA/ribD-fused uncharacterized protein
MANHKLVFFWSIKPSTTGFLSQWYCSPFIENGIFFNCAEQYMMYRKAVLFKDEETGKKIVLETNPMKQKQLGRMIHGFVNKVWLENQEEIVKQGNRLKFQQNPDLLKKLCQTEGELVEASPYDDIWGIGMDETNPKVYDRSKWGLNLLGKILMELREEFLLC